jgi:hypothetical protein
MHYLCRPVKEPSWPNGCFPAFDISQDELDRLWAHEADSRIDAYERSQIKTISAQKVFKNIYS